MGIKAFDGLKMRDDEQERQWSNSDSAAAARGGGALGVSTLAITCDTAVNLRKVCI